LSEVKILDFGLARGTSADEEGLTRTGMVMGTPGFMAPEQADGEADQGSDLFSLGCVLYLMLTGELAFRGGKMLAAVTSLASDHPKPPVEINAKIPPKLSEAVMQLLEKDPAKRKATAEGVARFLGELQTGKTAPKASGLKPAAPTAGEAKEKAAPVLIPSLAKAPEQAPPDPKPVRRQRKALLLAAVGAAAFGLMLLGIIIVFRYRGVDGKTSELSIAVGTTTERSSGGAGEKPPGALPPRYKNSLGMEFVLVPRGGS
jgi:urea transport system substrate-binding protein